LKCAGKEDIQDEITINTSSQACSQQIEFYWTSYQWKKYTTQDPVKRMPPGGCALLEGSHHKSGIQDR
jgi:hypothetical protein